MREGWLFASLGLVAAVLAAAIATGLGDVSRRFVAVQFLVALSIQLLVALSFAFDQASALDLALTLALLTLPGTLLFALFEERWL